MHFFHLEHAYLHVVFDILLAFAAAGCARCGHKAGQGNFFAAFFATAGAAVAQQVNESLKF